MSEHDPYGFNIHHSKPCPCEGMGCDECGCSYRIVVEQVRPEPGELTLIGGPMNAILATVVANVKRANLSGYELTEEQVSPAEMRLSDELYDAGIDFVQQWPCGPYFPDFYFPASRVVVEVDGDAYHTDAEKDARRTAYLLAHGVSRVVRLRAITVFTDPVGSANLVKEAIR